MEDDYLTFIHKFSRSVQCTLRIPNTPPAYGSMLTINMEWSGRIKRKHVPAYRQWILSTNQILCDRWETTMLYALGTHHNRTEVWSFKPGECPKLVDKLNVGIP